MAVLRWIAQRGLRVTMFIALVAVVYHIANELRVFSGRPPNFLQRLELLGVDVKFAARGQREPDTWRVAIAALDERSIARFGPPPWSRTVHADLVNRLTEAGVGSIAFDMTFEQPQVDDGQVAIQKIVEEAKVVGLKGASKTLENNALLLERAQRDLRKLRRSAPARRIADRLDKPIAKDREVRHAIERFGATLEEQISDANPDRDFAKAIAKSGRVVLGVVNYSKTEAELLERSPEDHDRALHVVRTSTINELIESGDGVGQIYEAGDLFDRGVYRKYFGVLAPTDVLAQATPHFATINASPDEDGVNRRIPLVSTVKGSGWVLPTLALKAVQVAVDSPIELVSTPDDLSPQAVRVGDLVIDTELAATTSLDWYGRFAAEQMPIHSISDIVDGKVPAAQLKDRVVFVAATAIGTHDQRVTPLERAVPGVYIHATLAQNILDGRHLARPLHAIAIEIALFLLIGLITGLVMTRFQVIGQVVTAFVLAAVWIVADQLVFFREGVLVYTVLPVLLIFVTMLAVAMWSFFVEQRERRKTKQAFGRYLAPRVMEHVLGNPEVYLKLGGNRYEATVLFSDIRGFTTISEQLTPEELGKLLNEYMTPMTDIVFEFEGTLDKYIGDAVMAFWGAPIEQSNHALLACKASLQMLKVVEKLNERFLEEGLPHIAIGIGLSSGPMTIGNMGSADHFAYTALGDRVNLGARLEGQTKEYGVEILISEDTKALVEDDMLCRELGSLRVKGKFEPVRIFELVGAKHETASRLPFVEAFHEGLAAFREQNWEDAIASFTRARALSGIDGDKASDLYVAWCMEYQADPPPPDWDGVRIATSK